MYQKILNYFISYPLKKLYFKIVSNLSNNGYVFFYNLYCFINKKKTRIFTKKNNFVLKNSNFTWTFFHKNRGWNYCNGLDFRKKELLREYLIEDINFYDNDIVIDCGANIGDFFLCFDKKIKYIGIEPSPSEFSNLQKNVPNQIILNKALWNKSNEVLNFYIASEDADSSLIEIKNYEKIEKVQTITLDDLIDELKQNIKLIKLEAEGAEPEILEGLKKNINKVNYITIDAGFERGLKLESTLVPCINYLLSNNYKLLDYGHERVTLKFENKNFNKQH